MKNTIENKIKRTLPTGSELIEYNLIKKTGTERNNKIEIIYNYFGEKRRTFISSHFGGRDVDAER